MVRLHAFLAVLIALALVLGHGGCSSGGEGDDEEDGRIGIQLPENLIMCIDVSGEWTVDETTTLTCSGEPETTHELYTMTVLQGACNLRVTFPGGILTGSIEENSIVLNGSLAYNGGTSTVDLTLTISKDGNTFRGVSAFTWTDGAATCTGTSELLGGRTDGTVPCVDVMGEWIVTETVGPNSCGDPTGPMPPYSVTMEQQGCVVYVWTPWSMSPASIDGNTISWNTSYYEEGGMTDAAVSVTVAGDSIAGTATWTWTDGTTTCDGVNTLSGTSVDGGGETTGVASQFIDAYGGGTVTVTNDRGDVISLEVPPGALPASTVIVLTALTDPVVNPIAVNIWPGVVIQPHDLSLNLPATLKVTFAAEPGNLAVSMLSWVVSPEFVVPIANQRFTATELEGEIHHFSPYTGSSPTAEELIQQAELLAEAIEKGLLEDPYGWLDAHDIVNGMLQASNYFETVGNTELAETYLDGAKGALEQAAYKFLNMPVPAAPCGQYHAVLVKFAQLVEVLLGDPTLEQAFQARLATIEETCVIFLVGVYQGWGEESWMGCQDPEDNGTGSGFGVIEIDSQTNRSCSGHSGTGLSLGQFSGPVQPIGFVYGIPAYSLRGTATYVDEEYYVDEHGYTQVHITRGTASYAGTKAGATLAVTWTFQDTSGDSCAGKGSGKFTKQ